jgi:CBS domain containing-hemolysin-like protein
MGAVSALLIMVLTMLLSAFFSGSETAAVSSSKVRLRHRAKKGSIRARMLEGLLGTPERFFSVVLVGTNISVIVCTAAATALAVSLFGDSGALVATVVMTPLILIFSEVIPKSAFLYHADRVSIAVAPLLKFFYYILLPIVIPATFLAHLVLKLTGAGRRRFNLLSTKEELIHLYRGQEEDPALRREHLIIDRVFRFGSATAKELMVPLERVVTFPVTASVEDVIDEANKHTYSRFPVISPLDNRIVGIISLFDLLGLDGGVKLGSVMQSPLIASEEESAEKLLLTMKEEALHMAVIEDEGKQPLGIVTLEDLLENIVGDIASEYE